MSALGRLPQIGDIVDVDGRRLTVLSLEGRRVDQLRIAPIPTAERVTPEQSGAA
jgi:putative hemolysin